MFARTCALIICLGLVACAMLSLRQQRIEAAHELTKAQARLAELDRSVLRLRVQIAARTAPDRVHEYARTLGPLAPLRMDRYEQVVRAQSPRDAATAPAQATAAASAESWLELFAPVSE